MILAFCGFFYIVQKILGIIKHYANKQALYSQNV